VAVVGLVALLALSQLDGGEEPDSTTLAALLLKKSILTQAEYEAAVAGVPPPDDGRSPLMNKWTASLYGFVELDAVGASTQSGFEQVANAALARPTTYEGTHVRVSFGGRNSRLGLKLSTPVLGQVRASAVIEADLFGNTVAPTNDAAVFTGAGPHLRHLAISVETPIVDVLLGQWWQLFGWQPNFFPNTVEIQGIVAEANVRVPQARLSHVFKTAPLSLEAAIAVSRPADRLFGAPDVSAGARVQLNRFHALRTSGATATRADAAMLGVSALVRRFDAGTGAWGWGLSLDALVPIIGGDLDHRANAFTLTGSFITGAGIADQQSAFTAGIGSPSPSIDNGLVALDAARRLHPIIWRTVRVGAQYYLPPDGRVWLAVNFGQNLSPNAGWYGPADKVYVASRQGDVSVFFSPLTALRFGLEYVYAWQRYADGIEVHDHRGILAAYFLF
jgi:hypothetical protein